MAKQNKKVNFSIEEKGKEVIAPVQSIGTEQLDELKEELSNYESLLAELRLGYFDKSYLDTELCKTLSLNEQLFVQSESGSLVLALCSEFEPVEEGKEFPKYELANHLFVKVQDNAKKYISSFSDMLQKKNEDYKRMLLNREAKKLQDGQAS